MKLPRAILFDHDGVLVSSELLHGLAWKEMLGEIGIPYADEEFRALIGSPAPLILARLLDQHLPGWSPREFDLEALALKKNDIYLALASTGLRAYPGVREGLEWLKTKGIRTAVVSNAKRRELSAALDGLKLTPLLDVMVSRDEVPNPKPDPAPYLMGAAAVGFDPGDCMAVEDSPLGLEAALKAQVPAAAVLTNFPRAAVAQPVAGRADLKPVWIGASIQDFFDWLRILD